MNVTYSQCLQVTKVNCTSTCEIAVPQIRILVSYPGTTFMKNQPAGKCELFNRYFNTVFTANLTLCSLTDLNRLPFPDAQLSSLCFSESDVW